MVSYGEIGNAASIGNCMMRFMFIAAITVQIIMAQAQADALSYEMDKRHTIIQFTWNHNRLSNMSGRFLEYDGEFDLDFDDPSKSSVSVTIDPASIWTGVEELDEDMKSARLFNVAEYDKITFVSTKARQTGLETGELDGELTIKGVTKPVRLFIDVNYQGPHVFADGVEKFKDALQVGLTLHTRVNRSDFGLGMAVPWIADEIDIRIDTEMVAYPNGKPSAAARP